MAKNYRENVATSVVGKEYCGLNALQPLDLSVRETQLRHIGRYICVIAASKARAGIVHSATITRVFIASA